jgi:hypothetical protein
MRVVDLIDVWLKRESHRAAAVALVQPLFQGACCACDGVCTRVDVWDSASLLLCLVVSLCVHAHPPPPLTAMIALPSDNKNGALHVRLRKLCDERLVSE